VTMKQISDLIRTFFEDFERASNTFDQELLASQLGDPFMAADPHGGIQVVKKDDFLAGVAKRQAFFSALGFQFVRIVPLEETRLDSSYVLVKAHTSMRFQKGTAQPIDIGNDSTYILFVKDASPKIVFNLTHEDLMKVMRENGLLPERH
jgi:hypothetical protein